MTKEMIEKWLAAYNELEQEYDRWWDKMERHEREGKLEQAKRNEMKMDLIAEKQKGMVETLEIFGYTAQQQNGNIVVVEK